MPNWNVNFPRDMLTAELAAKAKEGVYLGTSSWKYEGWLGLLYSLQRYETRGKFSRAKFEETCLSEYAEVFKTVCLDAGFYQFPNTNMLDGYLSQVPSDFRLSLKVLARQVGERSSALTYQLNFHPLF